MFSSLREPELTLGAFGFCWNPPMKILYVFTLVLVNPKYIAPLKLTMNWGEGALPARSFSAAFPQFSATWIMVFWLEGASINFWCVWFVLESTCEIFLRASVSAC